MAPLVVLQDAQLAKGYDKNSVESNADLVKTYATAGQVAEQLTKAGSTVPVMAGIDAWGRPMCVSGNASDFIVISGGEQRLAMNCAYGDIPTETLKDMPRAKLIRSAKGYLILILPRTLK
jgi:hypothetical protein